VFKSIKDEPPSKKSKFDNLLSMKKESASSRSDESDTTEDDDWKPVAPVEAAVVAPKKATKEKLNSKPKKVTVLLLRVETCLEELNPLLAQ
jgi:hypothetical protein